MGTYFPPLNLSLDADERAVKRAYAALLKETRPDDDPQAFQALVSARDRALAWVRRRADTGPVTLADPSEAPTPSAAADIKAELDAVSIEVPMTPAAVVTDAANEGTLPDLLATADVVIAPLAPVAPVEAIRLVSPADFLAGRIGPESDLAAAFRTQQTARLVLSRTAINLVREEAEGANTTDDRADIARRWAAIIAGAEDLDLAGRLALERSIVVELDAAMHQLSATEPSLMDVFEATVLTLDRAFRWSHDLRRVVRILGEPSGAHPLVFAIERFGELAVRMTITPSGFPVIPAGDLVAWFGTEASPGAQAYVRAARSGRFGLGWSWFAFLTPPSWGIRFGLPISGIGFALAMITAIYVMFDPINTVETANAFVAFLAVLIAARTAAALSARSVETGQLVRVIKRIEAGPLPTTAERRRRIAAAHGSKILHVVVGLFFLLLVDGYCLSLIIPAVTLPTELVGGMIVVLDRKTPGVTFADRLVAESYLDHAREIAEGIDALVLQERTGPPNPLRRQRVAVLLQKFKFYTNTMPIGDYAADFAAFRREIGNLKRQSPD